MRSGPPPAIAHLLSALVFLIPVAVVVHPVIFDPDLWWHLATGRWIATHGAIPTSDPFALPTLGREWVAYGWIFDLACFELYLRAGLAGLVFAGLGAAFALVASLRRLVADRLGNPVREAALVGLGLFAVSPLLTPRPWLASILLVAVTLEVVLARVEGRTHPFHRVLPLGYALVANLHVQWVYGLAVLAVAWVATRLDNGPDPLPLPFSRLAILCGLATLANPHGTALHRHLLEIAGQTGIWDMGTELQAMRFRSLPDWGVLGLLAAALLTIGGSRRPRGLPLALVLVGGALGFRAARDVWMTVLCSLAALALATGQAPDPSSSPSPDPADPVPLPGAPQGPVLALVLLGTGLAAWGRGFSEAALLHQTARIFPADAVAAIRREGLVGPLYNPFDWGGYLIFALPELPVSMDGRAALHGDRRIARSLDTWSARPGWERDSELAAARVVLGPTGSALIAALARSPEWRRVHADPLATVLAR